MRLVSRAGERKENHECSRAGHKEFWQTRAAKHTFRNDQPLDNTSLTCRFTHQFRQLVHLNRSIHLLSPWCPLALNW